MLIILILEWLNNLVFLPLKYYWRNYWYIESFSLKKEGSIHYFKSFKKSEDLFFLLDGVLNFI